MRAVLMALFLIGAGLLVGSPARSQTTSDSLFCGGAQAGCTAIYDRWCTPKVGQI